MSSTTLGELREQAAPWLHRSGPSVVPTVDTADRADWAVWDQISHDCVALAEMDAELADRHGVPGLVRDLWMSAYARDPQVREADEVAPAQRSHRAIAAAVTGTPELADLRRSTVGDPYAAALAVLAQKPALRKMLRTLDPHGQQRKAQQARRAAEAAADQLAEALRAAEQAAVDSDETARDTPTTSEPQPEPTEDSGAGEDGVGEDGLDVPGEAAQDDLLVPRPELVDAQRAIAEASAAAADAQRAEEAVAALGEGDTDGDEAMRSVRAAARAACAGAAEAVEDEAAAMTAWGIGPGQRERLDPDERLELARKLQSGKLKAFAELVGRFRQLSQAQRARRVEHARGEYVGVTIGDDLTSLIPAELVNLAVPALRAQFAVRYAEQQLMVYEQRGEEHEGQGAVIVCVDCSRSMVATDEHGISGEAYAKALALALLEQARHATPVREFAALLFSERTDAVITFPADQPVELDKRIRLAETFTGGGTEFEPVLTSALRLLEAEYNTTGRQRADIVFVTDGEARLSEAWLTQWHEQKKHLGFRCFGIQIGQWSSLPDVLDSFCDDVRRIEDLTDTHATADIFRAI